MGSIGMTRRVSTQARMWAKVAILMVGLGMAWGELTMVGEDDWRQLMSGEWMVEFAAPWCPACRALQPTWEEFAGWSEDLEVGIGQVDVTASPGLSGRFMVTALPTIFHVKDGVFRQYRGARDKDSFISYIEDKKWSGVEPISTWKAPDSFQMSMVSYFFKLSMVLRNVHTTLTEDYKLPSWASYVAFALATIALGGVLGLVLVCCIDCVYPPRREMAPPKSAPKREDKKDSDVEEDDIEDIDASEEGSQDEMSQNEDEGSQDDRSQDEASQDEDSFRPEENRSRRRKPRKV